MQKNRVMRVLGAFAFAAALLVTGTMSIADKVHLKDGRIVDGTIIREEGGIIIVKMMVDGQEKLEYISQDDVQKIVRDEPAKPASDKPVAEKPAAVAPEKAVAGAKSGKTDKPAGAASGKAGEDDKTANQGRKNEKITGRPTRVAILNFGLPAAQESKSENMVGVHIAMVAYQRILPILEKEKVDVVVLRINSGGGYSMERGRLAPFFQNVMKPKFRLAGWVESAISAAAMSPWVIEEFYMMPEGAIGGCTSWSGDLHATSGYGLAEILADMEESSRQGGRDPKIMRSMQILEPLSCTKNEDGSISFFQDLTGKILVNRPGEILTLHAKTAEEIGFSKGTAATVPELMKAMGIEEYDIVAKEASKYIDDFAIQAQRTVDEANEVGRKYILALNLAANLQDRSLRLQEIGIARKYLGQMKKWVELNPVFRRHVAGSVGAELSNAWFDEQERILKELAK